MRTPLSRALEITSFMRGAISATRRVAPLHQCSFHMSQMMMAVFAGSHPRVSPAGRKFSEPSATGRFSGLSQLTGGWKPVWGV